MKPIILTRWVILDCDGKPLSGKHPWIYCTADEAGQTAAQFTMATIKKVTVTINEATDE